MQEFYGTVRWSVKSIFNGYLGWFSGNISELDPTSTFKRAKFVSNMVGGPDALFAELEKAIANEENSVFNSLSPIFVSIEKIYCFYVLNPFLTHLMIQLPHHGHLSEECQIHQNATNGDRQRWDELQNLLFPF